MTKTYLGVDCGSVSVKMAVLDKDNNLIAKVYLENQGLKDVANKTTSCPARSKSEPRL